MKRYTYLFVIGLCFQTHIAIPQILEFSWPNQDTEHSCVEYNIHGSNINFSCCASTNIGKYTQNDALKTGFAGLLPQSPHPRLGPLDVLIIRTNNVNEGTMDFSEQRLEFFRQQLDPFLIDGSHGKTSIGDWDLTPIYNIDGNSVSNFFELVSVSQNSATSSGYDLSNYEAIIYYGKSLPIPTWGFGVGVYGYFGWPYELYGEVHKYGFIHEFTHTFNYGHSNIVEGGDDVYPGDDLGGLDPYTWMGSGNQTSNAITGTYLSYWLGWLEQSNVQYVPDVDNSCVTSRIYMYNHDTGPIQTSRTYAMQYSDEFWFSYNPDFTDPKLQTKGVVIHYIPAEFAEYTRLIDVRPNSITEVPEPSPELGTFGGNWAAVVDFWDAAMELGDEVIIDGFRAKVTNVGGSGINKWVDVEICDCILLSGDTDNDGVCDAVDRCPGFDDSIDSDGDGVPDDCDCVVQSDLNMERWDNIGSGVTVDQIPLNTSPTSTGTLGIFQTATNSGDNYGLRVSGLICAPQTGEYTFWIASDDNGELWLSTDENSQNKQRIAHVPGWTNPLEWTKFPEQESSPILLEIGKQYYIEAIMKEGQGIDNLAVGWRLPDGNLERPMIPLICSPQVGAACDDGISCTTDEIYDEFCNCVGVLQDSDGDGVCDTDDDCPNGNNNLDDDGDGIPNACDESDCSSINQLKMQRWNDIGSGVTVDLVPLGTVPSTIQMLDLFETATSSGDNYGVQVSGMICPPQTGNYTFWIASDNNGELWLSTDKSPQNKQRIAHVPEWTNSREWTKFSEQESSPIFLEANKIYYIEAIMKAGGGGDNLAVGWMLPNGTLERPLTLPSCACDDGDPCTIEDAYNDNCDCVGTFASSSICIAVDVKTILQGPYTSSANMNIGLNIPLTEPYTGLGYAHKADGGGESISPSLLNITGSNAIVDWVVVELRDPTIPSNVIATRAALLQADGDVVNVDGVSPVGFAVPSGDYYVAIRHRNHLGIMTATPMNLE